MRIWIAALAVAGLLIVACSSGSVAPTITAPRVTGAPEIPSPMEVEVVNMFENAIGTPIVEVALKNVSDKIIDAYEVLLCPHNVYGESLSAFGFGDPCLKGSGNTTVHPQSAKSPWLYSQSETDPPGVYRHEMRAEMTWNKIAYPEWTLNGYETTVSVDVALLRVHFQDGSTWER